VTAFGGPDIGHFFGSSPFQNTSRPGHRRTDSTHSSNESEYTYNSEYAEADEGSRVSEVDGGRAHMVGVGGVTWYTLVKVDAGTSQVPSDWLKLVLTNQAVQISFDHHT
jgi:hypothetical protein